MRKQKVETIKPIECMTCKSWCIAGYRKDGGVVLFCASCRKSMADLGKSGVELNLKAYKNLFKK